MGNFVTIRRWSIKDVASEPELVDLVQHKIVPAYKAYPGCLSLNLLRVEEPQSYLAVTYWQDRDAFQRWTGPDGQSWRDEYRPTLERWLELMTFQEEMECELLVTG